MAVVGTLLLCAGVTLLGYHVEQSDFMHIAFGFGISLIGYFTLIERCKSLALSAGLAIGFIARLILLPSFPLLSDDIFRFYWDGQLMLADVNPYLNTPANIPSNTIPNQAAIFSELNSPNYYSVYPPMAQAIFYIAAWLSQASIQWFSIILSGIFILFEALTAALCINIFRNWNVSPQVFLFYFLHPLVIVEGVGNLHFEIVMVSFLAMSLYYFVKKRWLSGIAALAVSVLTKLTSLIVWPFLIGTVGPKRWLSSSILGVAVLLTLYVTTPLHDIIQPMTASLDLYFRNFEFNGSIYAIARWLGIEWKGYNLIAYVGPGLAWIAAGIIILCAFSYRRKNNSMALAGMTWAMLVYYLFATTVHPWYVIMPLFLSIATSVRTPIIWASVVWLSYAHYGMTSASSSYFIAIEYAVVFAGLVWDFRRGRL